MKILCMCLIMIVTTLTACSKNGVDIGENGLISSGDAIISDGSKNNNLNEAFAAYKNFVNTSNRENYPDNAFALINLDESNIPFLFDGYKFYHYEDFKVKEILNYTVDRPDRTQIYIKEESPFILEIYNIFGEQSWSVYKYENNNFIKEYYSGIYAVTEDAEYAVLNGECEWYTDEIGIDIDKNINKILDTTNYELEYNICNTFTTIEEAIEEYKSK